MVLLNHRGKKTKERYQSIYRVKIVRLIQYNFFLENGKKRIFSTLKEIMFNKIFLLRVIFFYPINFKLHLRTAVQAKTLFVCFSFQEGKAQLYNEIREGAQPIICIFLMHKLRFPLSE